MNYWLMKSEPDVFGITQLENKPARTEHWDGVRNYQVRNMLRDQMQCGDQAFFYHSSCAVPGIAGIVEIVRAGYPDFTAFDASHDHYDPKSKTDAPTWFMVDVRHVRTLKRIISLAELKERPELAELGLLRRGNRLSIMPVTATDWQAILQLE